MKNPSEMIIALVNPDVDIMDEQVVIMIKVSNRPIEIEGRTISVANLIDRDGILAGYRRLTHNKPLLAVLKNVLSLSVCGPNET